jgi:hypothetical protein
MRVNYTLIFVYTMLLVTGSQSKMSHVFAWIWRGASSADPYANCEFVLEIKAYLFAKKRFLPGYGPIAIADWSNIVHCHLLVKLGT